MSDVLLYWRAPERRHDSEIHWPAKSSVVANLQAGDRLWIVAPGASLKMPEKPSGFLIGIWKVKVVIQNSGEPKQHGGNSFYRIALDESESIDFDPIPVDHLLRPEGRDGTIPIGRFLSVPRRLNEQLVRKLRAAAGPELALRWLTGTRR